MSIEINLKRKLWPRTFRFTGNYRTYTIVIFITFFITLTIYSYHYTSTNIIDELKAFSEERESDKIILRFERRRKHLNDECKKFGLDKPGTDHNHKLNAWEFLINEEYGLVYCNIFKAASSSWLYNFNLLAGYSPEYLENASKTPVSLARSKYPRPSREYLQEALNKHLSFIIVRHPFERLVSAYVDKFIKNAKKEYFRKIGMKIIEATRTKWRELNGSHLTTLSSEVKKKIEELKYVDDSLPPTFEEFIRYIICESKSHNRLNEHWEPMTPFCTPCLANFDLIMKFETLESVFFFIYFRKTKTI
ncbi:carbohydrate sulfotransferase 11-like isoform X2 [Chelonus insularis]|uniref:carbohydrate sulfotransferase 11-like isoform X2 n=1 Tax=Chelonus insularis TaxID=460826 RepID=UPI00158D17D2|nr:carbohydrate sulfotransferase 11-like isoform X2 [Chelonus insularis]